MSEDRGHSNREQLCKMERQHHVLYRVYLLTLAAIGAVVFLTILDLQSVFFTWALPSVAVMAWVGLAVAALFQMSLGLPIGLQRPGQFRRLRLAARQLLVVAGAGVAVWLVWSAYGPL